jgi:hypothetical protein
MRPAALAAVPAAPLRLARGSARLGRMRPLAPLLWTPSAAGAPVRAAGVADAVVDGVPRARAGPAEAPPGTVGQAR